MRSLKGLAGLLFAASLVWGILHYGAVESHVSNTLFLLMLAAAAVTAWRVPAELFSRDHIIPVAVVGALLLVEVLRRDSLTGHGYTILALGWMAFFVTVLLTADDARTAKNLFLLLTFIGCAEALYGLVQSLGGLDYIGTYYRNMGRKASGTLINPNHFSGLLNMTLPLVVGTLFMRLSKRRFGLRSEFYSRAWVMLAGCSFMGLAVILSASRAGTATMLASLLFLLIMWRFGKSHRRRNLSAVAVLVLLVMIVGLGFWVGMDALQSKFGMVESDLSFRGSIYSDSLRLIADNRFFGVGPGMYQWRFRPYQSIRPELWFKQAHNDYLQSAAEWGVPLALLFWGFVLWQLMRTLKVFLQSHHPERQGIALGCSAAILSILLHSFVDFNLQIPTTWMIFCSILGLSWNLAQGAERRRRQDSVAVGE